MIGVAVVGMGMMGRTHLAAWLGIPGFRVAAVVDSDPARLADAPAAAGNIPGQDAAIIPADARRYRDLALALADPAVAAVDLCLPTPGHHPAALAALAAGRHVLVEKPLARTWAQARELAAAASRARTVLMPAMCMRFWPGWDWLHAAVSDGRHGRVLAATFHRTAPHPGGPFHSDGEACGGALLELHIHDTDFICHCFGVPDEVVSHGYTRITGRPDHLATCYRYRSAAAPRLVLAEGGWTLAPGSPFTMRCQVVFERATATYEFPPARLRLAEGGIERDIPLAPGLGYQPEIAAFAGHVRCATRPAVSTAGSAAAALAVIEAEERSLRSGRPEPVATGIEEDAIP